MTLTLSRIASKRQWQMLNPTDYVCEICMFHIYIYTLPFENLGSVIFFMFFFKKSFAHRAYVMKNTVKILWLVTCTSLEIGA